MKVKDLIAKLQTLPQGAEVFVNNVEVQGAEVAVGRVKEGYGQKRLARINPTKDTTPVVLLTNLVEGSDGEFRQSPIFPI